MSAPEKLGAVSAEQLEESVNGSVEPAASTLQSEGEHVTPEIAGSDSRTIFEVVSGHPSDVDLAALAAVLMAIGSSSEAPGADQGPGEVWGSPVFMHRNYRPFSYGSYTAPRN